jgi:hypothetical protein
MNILVLRSSRLGAHARSAFIKDPYSLAYNTTYAMRFLGHLRAEEGYCRACADNCRNCRVGYGLDFSSSVTGVIDFPSTMPAIIDDPYEFVPRDVPTHDVLVALSVNEEVLLAFLRRHPIARVVIVPIEQSDWITPYWEGAVTNFCEENGIEVSFPKPFCSFDPGSGVLKEFKDNFRIGRPEIDFVLRDGIIEETRVLCSAPCGATYFTARCLEGRRVDEDLAFVIDSALSAYPCTAGRTVDRDFNDSITHQAVKLQRDLLKPFTRYSIEK